VPPTVSPLSVRDSILRVPGVLSLHELHIWQLSESKLVASVHILVERDRSGEDGFMRIARGVRRVMHEHGVHSCTVQPEYPREHVRGTEGLGGVEEEAEQVSHTPSFFLKSTCELMVVDCFGGFVLDSMSRRSRMRSPGEFVLP
jgi:hypothetical protein